MPRFFVQSNAIQGDVITIIGSDASHISRSLRMKVGEHVTVCDMQKTEYDCQITAITEDTVTLSVIQSKQSNNEPPYHARLFMALPKADKMEFVIQKAVEMGVSEIIPYRSERSVVKLDSQNGEKKRQRWQKIADSAAGQCGRGILPVVHAPMDFDKALSLAVESEFCFVCYEGEDGCSLPSAMRALPAIPKSVSFFVGAEGGIAHGELQKMAEVGVKSVGLGPRILRCESAPLYVLACLSAFWEI